MDNPVTDTGIRLARGKPWKLTFGRGDEPREIYLTVELGLAGAAVVGSTLLADRCRISHTEANNGDNVAMPESGIEARHREAAGRQPRERQQAGHGEAFAAGGAAKSSRVRRFVSAFRPDPQESPLPP